MIIPPYIEKKTPAYCKWSLCWWCIKHLLLQLFISDIYWEELD